MAINFIELQKLKENSDEKYMLVAWTEFLKDKVSVLSKGKNDGIKQGLQQGIIETAKNLLKLDRDISLIKEATKLSEEEIMNLNEILEK